MRNQAAAIECRVKGLLASPVQEMAAGHAQFLHDDVPASMLLQDSADHVLSPLLPTHLQSTVA